MFQAGLAKSIFGILLGAGGALSPAPMAYVAASRTAYKSLGKKKSSSGSPICSGVSINHDNTESRGLVVYDSKEWLSDPWKEGGVFRFVQGTERVGVGFDGSEISKEWIKDTENVQGPGRRGNEGGIGYRFYTGDGKKEYGNTNIYENWGERNCGRVYKDEEAAIEAVSKLNKEGGEEKIKQDCKDGIVIIKCKISVADGSVLDWREEDKPTVTYSVV